MSDGYSTSAVAGSGQIATGLAACASITGRVHLLARSDASAWRAEEKAQSLAGKLPDADPSRIKVTTDLGDLADADIVVEAIVEDLQTKADLLAGVGDACEDAALASTTSALPISELGAGSGHADRFFGLHVFNPVHRMELVEVCLPGGLRDGIADRAQAWCRAMGKTPVEVPDQAGFVVNRLLFPYLFDAVHLMERTGMSAEDVDTCMKMGAAHPMGPLALLDFVGLDVSMAIGEALYDETGLPQHEPPQLLRAYVAERKLGRKSGEGFFTY